MMTSVIKEMPADPIQFLIEKMTKPEQKRVILVTPPGMKSDGQIMNEEQYNVGLMLTEHLKYSYESLSNIESISVGDLLRKELIKKSDFGKKILESNKDYSYIDDQIIIELVQDQIALCEQSGQSWVLEGFPRTRLQALALQ